MICVFIFFIVGCEYRFRPPPIYCENVTAFSYEEDLAIYQEGSSTIKQNGFINTSELKDAIEWDTEAIEWAARECHIEWDNYTYCYDSTSKVWKIEFKAWRDEGSSYIYEIIYLNSKGVTLLIVYGE